MTYRNNNNNNNNRRNNQQGGNFNNNNNYGGTISRGNNNVNPWDGPSMGGGNRGGSSNDALALANNLLNNLLRNQNQGNVPPSLLDMARYDGGYNNSPRGGGGYSNDGGFRMGRGGGGGRMSNNNNNNRRNNRIVKGAIRKPNAGNRKSMPQKNSNNSKQNDSANSTNKKNDDARNGDDKKEETVGAEPKRKNSPYSDVANDMFYCHLCAKHMWDSTSFENHLKGRTHQMMKEGVEESYRLRANMLRQEAKIAEQLKSIEIDRLKRLGKAIRAANQIREYCPMCDLQFYGHLSTHRKSEGHLDLKKFLHPKCDECTTEFHNRTEFDDHLLSPGHMKTSKTPPSYKSEESRKNRLQILTEADEIQGLREEKPKKEKKESPKEGETPAVEDDKKIDGEAEKMETDAVETADTSVAAVDGESKQDNDADEDADGQNDQPEIEPILDFNEGDEIGPEIETKIPKYNCKRQVGPSMISKLVCFECRLCNKYFDTEITSEIHTRTYNHHRLFVKFLNEKANETKIAQKRAAAAAEECERLKRIKLEPEMEVTKEEVAKSELYDPTEATGEDDPKDGANGNDDEDMDESASKAVEEEVKSEEQKVEEKPDEKMIVAEPIVESKPETVVQPAAETVQPATVVTPTPAVTTPAVTTPTPAATTPTPAAVTPTPVVKTSTPAAVTQAPTAAVPTPTQNVQPVQAPVQNQNQVAPQQQTQSHGQNNNQPNNQNNQQNKQFNNNRGGRGGRNNNRRGRYGGRY